MPVIKSLLLLLEATEVESLVIKTISDLTDYFPLNYLAGLAELPFPLLSFSH